MEFTQLSGMVLANLTESPVVKASVTLTATDSVTGFIVKDVLIASTPSLRVLNWRRKINCCKSKTV